MDESKMRFHLSTEDFLLIHLSIVPMEKKSVYKVLGILKNGNSLDWYLIIRKAAENSVLPQLYYNLRSLSLEEEISIPKEATKILKAAYYKSVAHSVVRLDILKCILKACKDVEIKVMPFKGIVLAENIYPKRHLRVMDDVDLLIPKIDQDKKMHDYLSRIILKLRAKYGAMNVRVHFHSTWRQEMGFWKSASETERIWKRAVETEIGGVKVPVMSLEDILLMCCYHSLGHSRLYLRDICDVFVILKLYQTNLDWDYIYKTAKRTRLAVPLYCTLRPINDFFDVKEVPKDILRKLETIWEVKLFKIILQTWSIRGRLFEIILLYREICRLRSLGVLYVIKFYLRNRKEAVKSLIGMIRSIVA